MDKKLQLPNEIEQQLKDTISHYGHDGFFHYLMSRHDKVRLLFCQQTVNDRTLISASIIESSYYGLNVDSKKMFLDALAKDNQGEIYNIELQCYPITKNELFRFQSYLFAQIIKQTKSEEKYEFKKVRQLIINNSTAIKGLKG